MDPSARPYPLLLNSASPANPWTSNSPVSSPEDMSPNALSTLAHMLLFIQLCPLVFLHVYTTPLCPPGSPVSSSAHLCPLLVNGTPSVNLCPPLFKYLSFRLPVHHPVNHHPSFSPTTPADQWLRRLTCVPSCSSLLVTTPTSFPAYLRKS